MAQGKAAPISDRFWDKVDKSGDCWLWTRGVHSTGYGWLSWNGANAKSHRVAYELANGKIEKGDGYHGTVVMHTCDNRLCCNPAHLVAGTQAENMRDMQRKGRRKGVCAGTANGRAKLTSDDLAHIARDTRSNVRIAKDYGVSSSTIDRAKTRMGV